MTTLDSSSAAESSMDEASNGLQQTLTDPNLPNANAAAAAGELHGNGGGDAGEEGEGAAEVWETFSKSFSQVQSVLDRNRALIQQVNENHQSRAPDNLVKNVALIQELNSNVSQVASLYSDLSSNFWTMIHQRRPAPTAAADGTVTVIETAEAGRIVNGEKEEAATEANAGIN